MATKKTAAKKTAANKTAAADAKPAIQLTRVEILRELDQHGWDGAVSYSKPKLAEMLEMCRAGKMDQIHRPKLGRPKLVDA